jgi:Glycosyl hydrolases family 16
VFDDDFDGSDLNTAVWTPHYLPEWSSRVATAATYSVHDGALRLSITPAQGRWLPDEHEPPLRVSGVQSGSRSGPIGSTDGQQPWRPGAVVREQQPPFRGWLPDHGTLAMRAQMTLSPRSMAAWWLVGWEQDPTECAEICVFEVFGDAVVAGDSAAIGCGLHAFRDLRVREDFAAPRVNIDIAEFHRYAVDWTDTEVRFTVDGEPLRSCTGPPTYPMQSMIAVFDFPDRSIGGDDGLVPELVVDRVWATSDRARTASTGAAAHPLRSIRPESPPQIGAPHERPGRTGGRPGCRSRW